MPNKKAKGIRAKTRRTLRNRAGKVTVNKMLQELPSGTKVQIKINSSVHSGMPHYRYQGKTGTVLGKQGTCFEVGVLEGKQNHVLVVNPAHLSAEQAQGAKA